MSERVTQPTEASKCNWASGGSAYPNTDPGSGVRDVGFKPKDYPTPGDGAIVPAEDHNFLWRLGMEMISWIRDIVARQWDDVSEGIYAASDQDLFRVIPGTTTPDRGSQIFKVSGTATGSTSVIKPCTDGEYIYYIGGTTDYYVVCADPTDGSEVYEKDVASVDLDSICADGGYVYVHTKNPSEAGLLRLDRSTGGVDSQVGTEYSCSRIATNGGSVAGIDPFGKAGHILIYSGIQGTITEDGTYNTGSASLSAIAIDSDQCYAGGTRNTNDVWCVALDDTSTAVWSTTLPVSSAPTVAGIAADGDRVYVSTDRVALTAGGNANLHCLDRMTGVVIWSYDVQPSSLVDLEGISVDHRYLYVVDANDDLHVIDKVGYPAQVQLIEDFGEPCCDGVSVIGNSNLTTELKRSWVTCGETTFQKVPGSDVNRRPFFNLAIPVNGRI